MRLMQMLDVSGANANSYDSGELATGFSTTACNTLYLINMSDLCYNITFTGGGPQVTGHLPNNWARPFKVMGNYDRFRIVGSNNPTGAGTAPFSHIVVESYYPNEDVSHLADTAIPNPTTPPATLVTAKYLQNLNDPAGTQVIEVQVPGAQGDTLYMSNQGNLLYQRENVDNSMTPIIQGYPGSTSPSELILGNDASHAVEFMSNLQVDSGLNVNLYSPLNMRQGQQIKSDTGYNLILNTADGTHGIQVQVNGATVWQAMSNLIQANQPFQVSTIQSASGTSLVITTKNTADAIRLQSNGANVLSILTNMIVAAQPIQANTLQSASGADLTLNTPSNTNNIFLEIGGVVLAQLQSSGLGLATFLSANSGAGVTNGLSVAGGASVSSGQLAPNQGAYSTANGSVSGQAYLFCPIWGTGLKIGIVQMLNNFQTATAVTLLFPSTITFGMVYTGSVGASTTEQFNMGGSAAAMRQATNLGTTANAAGADGPVGSFHALNIGQFGQSDRILINTTGGANINAFGWFIGQ